ncbi:hypothetical protein Q8A67_023421 [Cirrhinus molitorella]|uniref:Uncharacterized protein n=1 Tax=Cirrhinus molitorella TaxID=172907 RepID=A0AA88TKW4_9TELE|nr:hypothetical protein Q8A67_023421 [Cirrhinus molitorella]
MAWLGPGQAGNEAECVPDFGTARADGAGPTPKFTLRRLERLVFGDVYSGRLLEKDETRLRRSRQGEH